MAKADKLLSRVDLEALPVGNHHDGRGLYLAVTKNKETGAERRSWIFRYRFGAKIKHMGLGSLDRVTLPQARAEHKKWLPVLWAKKDPMEERDREQRANVIAGKTFKTVADEWLDMNKPAWRNPKHRQQAENTLRTYVHPAIGDTPIAAVTRQDVLGVLQPHWLDIPETMVRLRGRMARIFDFAEAQGYIDMNPMRHKQFNAALPSLPRSKRVTHHRSLPYQEMPAFMASLRTQIGVAARCLELTILCATRTTEARLARWEEFDLDKALWIIPGERAKSGRPHRVPLSPRAVAVLKQVQGMHNGFVFVAQKGKPLSENAMLKVLERMGRNDIVVHGFRSSFRMWAAETNSAPREVAEMALAHVLRDATEAAYQRSDLFERRRVLMQDWADFLGGENEAAHLQVVA
jgi:integrase